MSISEILHSFDRKERAWVVRNAIGSMSPPLDPKFLSVLDTKLKMEPPLAHDAWWAVDYHLDWLAAALHTFRFGGSSEKVVHTAHLNNTGLLKHCIEDIDLIIADSSRVILIEAKAFGGWDRRQLDSKRDRFDCLLGSESIVWNAAHTQSVQIYFVLMSMKQPPRKDVYKNWLPWMLRDGAPVWVRLRTSHDGSVKRPVRCDIDGIDSRVGTHWKIVTEEIKDISE